MATAARDAEGVRDRESGMSLRESRASIWSETPLHTAAGGGDLAELERALAAAAGPGSGVAPGLEARDVLGFTALHVAACEGSGAMVERLLTAGAAVDARAELELTPLMLAVARGRLEVVEWLLMAGADAKAAAASQYWSMLSFALRGGSLAILELLIAAGYAPTSAHYAAYFRLVLELTGHRVRFAEQGHSRGSAGESSDVWVVDRPMRVPAALLAPMLSDNPPASHAAGGVAGATRFSAWYYQDFEARPQGFAGASNLPEPGRGGVSFVELAHEVRCGRHGAAQPCETETGWSALAQTITSGRPAVVLALVRSAGWDPAAIAAESDDEAARHERERGIFPVHLGPLRELLKRALADENRGGGAGASG